MVSYSGLFRGFRDAFIRGRTQALNWLAPALHLRHCAKEGAQTCIQHCRERALQSDGIRRPTDFIMLTIKKKRERKRQKDCRLGGLNTRPLHLQCNALPTELSRLFDISLGLKLSYKSHTISCYSTIPPLIQLQKLYLKIYRIS